MKNKLMWTTTDPVKASIHYNTFDEDEVKGMIERVRTPELEPELNTCIAMANQWLYGKASPNFDYWKNRPELKEAKTEHPEFFERGRQLFMRHVLSSMYYIWTDEVRPLVTEVLEVDEVPEFWVTVEVNRALAGAGPENARAREEACKRLPLVDKADKKERKKRGKKG